VAPRTVSAGRQFASVTAANDHRYGSQKYGAIKYGASTYESYGTKIFKIDTKEVK
jgi:hypothetical protein